WGKPRRVTMTRPDLARLPDERDRRILESLCGAEHGYGSYQPIWGGYGSGLPIPSQFVLNPTLERDLIPRLCETGRLMLAVASNADETHADVVFVPIDWDARLAQCAVHITGTPRDGYTIG